MPASPASAPTILFAGYGGVPNGFARVIETLLAELHGLVPEWQLHHFAMNLYAPVAPTPWTTHTSSGGADDAATLERLLRHLEPKIVFLMDVPAVCAQHAAMVASCCAAKIVCYCAIDDVYSLPDTVLRKLTAATVLVSFTRYAHGLLVEGYRRLHVVPPPIATIPHGVDTALFKPLAEGASLAESRRLSRQFARRQLWPDGCMQDAFIVLNANRNQPFKRIDLTLAGFAAFARDKPDNVRLFLHMGNRSRGSHEAPVADRLGVRARLLCSTRGERHPHLPDAQLNLLYNACDVGINTSEREGWGLIAFEHGATLAAQLVPGHTSPAELWEPSGALLDLAPNVRSSPSFAHNTIDAASVASHLERLYSGAGELDHWSEAAFRNALQYRWPEIARRWHNLFATLLDRRIAAANEGQALPAYFE